MDIEQLKKEIEAIWQKKQEGEEFNKEYAITLANEVIDLLDCGKISVVEMQKKERNKNTWIVNQWVKQGILLYFLNKNKLEKDDINCWFDKCENKFKNWTDEDFNVAKIRAVNGSFVRKGAYFGSGCVIMPSFVNIGANIGDDTMIDSMTTIGSCAKIGKKCHISANVCIGGVLEPIQAKPVIIEDNCFIGAGCQITEGVIVSEGSIIGSGVSISSSVKIINRETGEIFNGVIPPYSVVVPGVYKSTDNISINCAVIIKTVTQEVRQKTSINELLR